MKKKFPSDNKELLIEVFAMKGEDAFITGINGHVTFDVLEEISALLDDCDIGEQGEGDYLFSAHHEDAQVGEFGRVEIPPWWDLHFIAYRPLKLGDSDNEIVPNQESLAATD